MGIFGKKTWKIMATVKIDGRGQHDTNGQYVKMIFDIPEKIHFSENHAIRRHIAQTLNVHENVVNLLGYVRHNG